MFFFSKWRAGRIYFDDENEFYYIEKEKISCKRLINIEFILHGFVHSHSLREIPHKWKEKFLDDCFSIVFLHIDRYFLHDWREVDHLFEDVMNVYHINLEFDLWSLVLSLEAPMSSRENRKALIDDSFNELIYLRYHFRWMTTRTINFRGFIAKTYLNIHSISVTEISRLNLRQHWYWKRRYYLFDYH